MYEIDRVKFGEFIAELRKEKGIKQKELAEKLYISDKAVSKWETGHSIPDVSLLVPLAEILGVTVTELLECRRIEAPESMDASHADALVKTVIGLSEEERSRRRKKNLFIYLACVIIALIENYCLYQLSDMWEFFLIPLLPVSILSVIFGAYFWMFIKEKLPAYYDENKINVYVDGLLHMNMPGVYFNNHNWPYIVRALRVWSAVGMVIFPLVYVLLEKSLQSVFPMAGLVIVLVYAIGGLFIPIYVLARKHQGDKTPPLKKESLVYRIIAGVLVLAAVIGLVIFGISSGAGTIRSGTRVMYISNEGRSDWSANYQYFNGFQQRNFWVEEEDSAIRITVVTQEGTIAMKITDADGNVIFSEENMGSGKYEVEATGKVTIRIDAKEHKGSFDIS